MCRAKLTMSQVCTIRNKIRWGYTVKELAEEFKVSEGTIRKYTINERRIEHNGKGKYTD